MCLRGSRASKLYRCAGDAAVEGWRARTIEVYVSEVVPAQALTYFLGMYNRY
jgi:hypothetical protein